MNVMDEIVKDYQQSLETIGLKIILLSANKDYVRRLIKQDALLPIDQALKSFIEQFRD